MHLAEFEPLPGVPHVGDVHQLRVFLAVAALEAVGDRGRGVYGREAGYAQPYRERTESHALSGRVAPPIRRRDYKAHLAVLYEGGDIVRRLAYLVYHYRGHPGARQYLRGAPRGVNAETERGVFLRHVHNLGLVAVPDGKEHAAPALHVVSRPEKPLEHRFLQRFAYAQHLSGGLHLGAEMRVHAVKFLKREHRHLHCGIGRRGIKARAETHVVQTFSQHRPGGEINHRHTRDLADIRHGTRGPRVHLDHVQIIVAHDVLHVHQPQGVER